MAVIGDAGIGAGMAFEALNMAGEVKRDLLVVLNDNRMSISPSNGALVHYFTKLRTSPSYRKWKRDMAGALEKFLGEKAKEAQEAGADHVGADDVAKKIQEEQWLDFDTAIATPDMMGVVGRLGKILGPRGLMPNPKVGTVTPDVAGAVRNAKAGQVRYRVDKAGIVHCTIGKASFTPAALKENLLALIADIQKHKPSTSKGVFLQRVSVSSTMGPGVGVDRATLGI